MSVPIVSRVLFFFFYIFLCSVSSLQQGSNNRHIKVYRWLDLYIRGLWAQNLGCHKGNLYWEICRLPLLTSLWKCYLLPSYNIHAFMLHVHCLFAFNIFVPTSLGSWWMLCIVSPSWFLDALAYIYHMYYILLELDILWFLYDLSDVQLLWSAHVLD